jgi:hypothetical protein
VIGGTRDIGLRDKEQWLSWKLISIIQMNEVLKSLTERFAPAGFSKVIATTRVQSDFTPFCS